jgi:hypothetical protein
MSIIYGNMNAVFSFELITVYVPECKQLLRTMKWYTQILDIAHFRYRPYVITPREPSNNQRPRCDIAWRFMLQILYTTGFRVKRLINLTLHVRLSNRLTRKTVVCILLVMHYSLYRSIIIYYICYYLDCVYHCWLLLGLVSFL